MHMHNPAFSHKLRKESHMNSGALLWSSIFQTQLPLSLISTSSTPWTAVPYSDFILMCWEIFPRQISGQWDSPYEPSSPQRWPSCNAYSPSMKSVTLCILSTFMVFMVGVLAWSGTSWNIFYNIILTTYSHAENPLKYIYHNQISIVFKALHAWLLEFAL